MNVLPQNTVDCSQPGNQTTPIKLLPAITAFAYKLNKHCAHFLKNVTLSCPTGGMFPRAACHWLTHNSYWLTQLSAVSSPTSPGQYTAHAQ